MAYLGDLGVRLRADGESLHVDAPKGKLPADLRAQIAERKAEILAYLKQQEACNRFVPAPIKPRGSTDPAPLSFAQERVWFLEQLEPEAAVYNICRASRLLGNLSSAALEASLNEIVSRHETLRTAFRSINGKPVQIFHSSTDISIKAFDLSSLPEETRQTEIAHTIKAEAERPFDLSAELLLRCTVIRARNDDHVVILTTHHIISDAWSMGILTRELWTLYEAFSNGRSSSLKPLPIQYSDYAVWQREWMQGDVLESQLDYWKERLKDLPVLNFPTDRPRKPHQSFQGARLSIVLPEDLTRSVNELSARFAMTPFMTLLAAFQVLLYRYTGQEDVVVGSPVANRRRPELEGLIGFFVNTVVLRTDLSGNPSFSAFLLRVRETCIGANANQELPFEKLVQELQPERDQSRNPLFQLMFVLQNATRPFAGIPSLQIEPVEIETTRSPFDLSLFLREREGKYIGYIEYSTELFDRDRIERMAGHYRTVLDGIVADPDESIATLPILTEAERRQILVEWNETTAEYPKDKCIHHLFEEQVERTPEAIALEFEDQQITYRELNCRANQLAHYLVTLGIGPEKLVGICVERSIEMVVGLLGILKAGGAYVPLDPAYPQERLRFMLEDSQASVLLTTQRLVEDRKWRIEKGGDPRPLILNARLRVVSLDGDRPKIEQQSSDNPNTLVTSTNLAYVIYTSGSTGKPKGVQIEHRSVVNRLTAIGKQIELTAEDKWLAVTTISFDIAVVELFLPLITSATVVLANSAESRDAARLIARLEISQANVMQATPSMWQLVLETDWQCPAKFTIFCGGETLPRALADRFLNVTDSVWNLYGPTESTIWSTMARVTANGNSISIGRPIANTQLYILDPNLQPIPIGVPGEIYIGGDGLARGYLNHPEVTSEKFVSNPFNKNPDSRLYCTGDVAKYYADATIEFLGRSDNQVKIRGHRIELSEIETVLNQHPSVKETVVVACVRDLTEEKDLAAYVVGSNEQAPTVAELRGFLQEKLPEFMIPSVFMFLDALPMTPNGKIDRDALPRMDGEPTIHAHEFVEPRTETEELVAQVWCELLKRDRINVHDNFFELGGHSLLATHIVSTLRDMFDRGLALQDLFDSPTIASLAAKIEGLIPKEHIPNLLPLAPVRRDGPLPLSVNQEHLWRLDQMLPGTHFFSIPYVYYLKGNLNVPALEHALQEIIMRHDALRTVFSQHDGQPLQIVKEVSNFTLPYIDLKHELAENASQKAAALILQEREAPFDLATAPLLRVKLIILTNTDYLLLVTTHHIIADEWSMRIFQRELALLYGAVSQGVASPFAKVSMQFPYYAVWENRSTRSGLFDAQLEYWRQQLSVEGCQLQTETDSETVNKQSTFKAAREHIQIEESLFVRVRKFCQKEGYTPFMVFLAALNLTIHFYRGDDDIRIGITTANRESSDRAGVVGNLTNTIILRTKVEPTSTVRQLLNQLRKTAATGYVNQDVPFEYMAQVLRRERGENHSTQFAVQVIYNHVADLIQAPGLSFAAFSMRGLEVSPEFIISDADLIFRLRELSTELTGSLTYKTAAIDQPYVVSIIAALKIILKSMLGMADLSLASILSKAMNTAALQKRWPPEHKEEI